MSYKKAKAHNIIKILNFFVSTALLTLTLLSSANSQTCPTIVPADYLADTSTLGYSTSYNESSLNLSSMDTSSTECKDLPSTTIAQPGLNCLYDGKPLCQSIIGSTYTIPAANILSSITPIPRFNCHDLIDLPLCELLTDLGSTTDDKKNCVTKCSDIPTSTDPNHVIRDQDYAVHNRDCVRFCDEISIEEALDSSLSDSPACVARSCHQLGWNVDASQQRTNPVEPQLGSGGNCNELPCNLLYPLELVNTAEKIQYDESNGRNSKSYCNKDNAALGNELKCYHFSKPQLKYTIRDKMCKIHKCTPRCSTYISQTDQNGDDNIDGYDHNDTLNAMDYVLVDPPTGQLSGTKSTGYEKLYSTHQYACLDLADTALCEPVTCQPVVDRTYRCTIDGTTITGTSADIEPNVKCGTTAKESDCSDNYCVKTIDCNIVTNQDEFECQIPVDDTAGTQEDGTTKSWFYRPKPLEKSVQTVGDTTIIDPDLDARLCYTENSFKDKAASWTDLAGQDDWGWDSKIVIPKVCVLGVCTPEIVIDMGYFHSSIMPDATRAGGMCKFDRLGDNTGFRGATYPYLCFREKDELATTGGQYQHISEHTAYYKGYVETTFLESQDAVHKLDVCLRYRNALRPDDGYSETCGSRECAVTCMGFAGGCSQQNCGYDVCNTFEVLDSDPGKCKMSQTLFDGDQQMFTEIDDSVNENNRECLRTIDGFLRIRVQKIGDYLCAFLDAKGHTAYPENVVKDPIQFVKGTEVITDENGYQYCLDGSPKSEGIDCNTFDTRNSPESGEKWRTLKVSPSGNIPYILNNQPSTSNFQGYIDQSGQVHLAQNCIKITQRPSPLDFYNIATPANSPKLFVPPVYIANTRKYSGGPISIPENVENLYGKTNFHYPEIEVRFGATIKLLSLDIGDKGNEDNVTTIETTVNDALYSEDIFIKKEYNIAGDIPILCLYQKIVSPDGTYTTPYKIGCVEREKPQIDNTFFTLFDENLPQQKIVVTASSTNTYDNSSISLQYLGNYGDNNEDDNCGGDDVCTQLIQLSNTNINSSDCDNTVEKYQVCAQREECSQLNNECMVNEVNIQNAIINGESTTSFLSTRQWCNNHLINICNNKLGLSRDPDSSVYNTNPSGATKDSKAYGWFNEICLTKGTNTTGFNDSLITVIAYDPATITNNVKGKCIVKQSSPYLTDSDPSTNCDDGGMAPNCLCEEYIEGIALKSGETTRKQTEREAGLCIDMPKPELCPTIDFNPVNNTNTDPDFVSWSLDAGDSQTYGDVYTSNIHISHQLRSQGVGHAEFPVSMMGINNVEGTCNGFWKKRTSGGITIHPTRNCEDINGSASWSSSVNNSCIRYSCPQIYTNSIYSNGLYSQNYGNAESSQEKGLSHGFALWPYNLKTTDFTEEITADSCIIGFKANGSTPNNSAGDNVITNYQGGSLPRRYCNQLGNWQNTQNNCQRITCSPVNIPTNYDTSTGSSGYQKLMPEGYYIETVTDFNGANSIPNFNHETSNFNPTHQLDDYSYTGRYNKDSSTNIISDVQWDYWIKSGGAMFFEKTIASRSDSFIEDSSKTTGYCNNELGFFQAGAQSPELECDHLGNWEVKNKCVTRCDIVQAGVDSEDENNGYSSWSATDVPLTDTVIIENNYKQVSGSCLTGAESTQFSEDLHPYPYPPLRDRDGENYKIYYTSSEYYNYVVGNVTLESHLDISQFTNDPAVENSIPADVSTDSRFHFLDSSDSVEKWSIPSESLPIGSSTTSSAPEPTRLCKWVKMDTGFTTNYWHPADSKCINSCPSGNYDPRLNVGITEHQIYDASSPNNTRKFYINWPSGTLGQWMFKTNTGFSYGTPPTTLTGLDASHFSNDLSTNPEGRTNAKYIIARKCGADGRWEDAQPHCATNNGRIAGSNAKYNSSSITNSSTIEVASSDVATGVCSPSPSYFPKGYDTGSPEAVSSYTCEYHDTTNKNIDQVYFKHKEGYPCEIYCYAEDDQIFGNAHNSSGDKYVKAGQYLNLNCNAGYGKAIGGPAGSDSTCGRNATDRTGTNPSILCSSATTGSWSSTVTNNCSECRDCTSSSGSAAVTSSITNTWSTIDVSTPTVINFDWFDNSCVREIQSCDITSCISLCDSSNTFNKSHGELVKIRTTEKSNCKRNCSGSGAKCTRDSRMDATMAIQCIDGKWLGSSSASGTEIICNSI